MSAWPPRDWRALLALIGSIGGAAMLTVFVWWAYAQQLPGGGWSSATEQVRAITTRWTLWIAVGTIAVVIVGLGMAINRRTIKGNLGKAGFEFDGGDEPEGGRHQGLMRMPDVQFGQDDSDGGSGDAK